MRLFSKILKHVFFVMSVSSLVQAGPEDILEEFLARDAAISQRVISREVSAGDVRGERDGLIADINGRLAGEGYQLGWTQNFGIDRELSGAAGWSISLGQGFAYDADTNVVSGKGFIAARTFDSSLFGDGPIIVGGSYSSINRESAFRLNVLQEKTFIGPVVTKGWNTQVFMVPVEGPEITVQFLNGAYQPLQVCAQILSAGILVPKGPSLEEVESHSYTYRRILDLAMEERKQRLAPITTSTGDTIDELEQQLSAAEEYGTPDQVQVLRDRMREATVYKASVDAYLYMDKDYLCVLLQTALEADAGCLKAKPNQIEYILKENGLLPDEADEGDG